MYAIAKLSKESTAFLSTLTSINSKLVEHCIAKAVADELPLPSSEVHSQDSFYIESCAVQAVSLISKINEVKVIDTEFVKEQVKRMWQIRYSIAHPKKRVFLVAGCCGADHFFGYAKHCTKEMSDTINANPSTTIAVLNGFYDVVCDLQCDPAQ